MAKCYNLCINQNKIMKKYYILSIICVFIALSCTNKKTIDNTTKVRSIILKDGINEIKLSDLVSNIKYIPLETKTNSLIGEILNIKMYNNKFYIISRSGTQSDIKVFATDGKFVMQFGNYGKGANEILNPADIIKNNDIFFVLDKTGIHSFTEDGLYLKKLFKRFPGRKFQFFHNYFYILHGLNPPGLVSRIDLKGNIKQTFIPLKLWLGATEQDKIIPIDDGLHIFNPLLDTVYYLNDNIILPKYYINSIGVKTICKILFENKKLNPYELSKQINSQSNASITNYNENDHYLYIDYLINQQKETFVLNKLTDKSIYFSKYINDIDNGYFGEPLTLTDKDLLIIPLYSYELIEYYKSYFNVLNSKNYPLWQIVKNKKIDDNPILMICKLEL